jgi:sulfur-carrier protein adenylyltransferase/sulfurtransferase
MRKIVLASFFIVMLAAAAFSQVLPEVQRITVEELKARLDKGDTITILDVRQPGSYNSSGFKIKGAVRIPPSEIAESVSRLPMGGEIVTYCT